MTKSLLLAFTFLSLSLSSWAAQTTLVTYVPAATAYLNEVSLNPIAAPIPCTTGSLYADLDNKLYYCNANTKWERANPWDFVSPGTPINSDINFSTGKVGIGLNPLYSLDVIKNGFQQLRLQSTDDDPLITL